MKEVHRERAKPASLAGMRSPAIECHDSLLVAKARNRRTETLQPRRVSPITNQNETFFPAEKRARLQLVGYLIVAALTAGLLLVIGGFFVAVAASSTFSEELPMVFVVLSRCGGLLFGFCLCCCTLCLCLLSAER